jgi:hypothetical protein
MHQEELIVNLYAPNVSAPNFIKQTLKDLQTLYHHHGSISIPVLPIVWSSRQKSQQRNPTTK